ARGRGDVHARGRGDAHARESDYEDAYESDCAHVHQNSKPKIRIYLILLYQSCQLYYSYSLFHLYL
ncbi:MAG: hypothetical protein MJ119_08290, partial [Lachnospiraceae bacterium]|nr:hypothetical protein [Lachnospiraceae bacterium]